MAALQMHQFRLTLTDATTQASIAYVADLDRQIDELQTQLQLLQGVRRAVAGTFGIDRREAAGKIGQAADRARRAEYEGDEVVGADGKFKPGVGDSPMAGRLVPRPVEGDA